MDDKLETRTKFPKEKVISALNEWWASETSEDSLRVSPPKSGVKVSILTPIIEIDLHRVVNALIVAEKIIGVDISESNIKEGGYSSFDDLIDHLVPRIECIFNKRPRV